MAPDPAPGGGYPYTLACGRRPTALMPPRTDGLRPLTNEEPAPPPAPSHPAPPPKYPPPPVPPQSYAEPPVTSMLLEVMLIGPRAGASTPLPTVQLLPGPPGEPPPPPGRPTVALGEPKPELLIHDAAPPAAVDPALPPAPATAISVALAYAITAGPAPGRVQVADVPTITPREAPPKPAVVRPKLPLPGAIRMPCQSLKLPSRSPWMYAPPPPPLSGPQQPPLPPPPPPHIWTSTATVFGGGYHCDTALAVPGYA